jgi:hypothetical protein
VGEGSSGGSSCDLVYLGGGVPVAVG